MPSLKRVVKTVLANAYTPTYSWETINTVAEWQNYGSDSKPTVAALLKVLGEFPDSVKKPPAVAHRFIFLQPKTFKFLKSGGEVKHREIESWTTSLSMAKSLVKDIAISLDINDTYLLTIVRCKPTADQVALNLNDLWKDKEWKKSVDYWEDLAYEQRNVARPKRTAWYFNEGLEFQDSQKEVVLRRTHFMLQDVVLATDYTGKSLL